MKDHPARSVLLATLLFLTTFAGDCFFTPREPEQSQTVTEVCEPVQSAEDMPGRMIGAMEDFTSPGFTCLLSADGFLFRPDVSDSTDLADIGVDAYADPWGQDREVSAFELLITCFNDRSERIGGIRLDYVGDPVLITDSTSTVKIIETDYALTILTNSITVTDLGDSVALGGSLRWVVHDEGDSWRITRWDDFRKGENPTWGYFTGGADGGVDFCPDLEAKRGGARDARGTGGTRSESFARTPAFTHGYAAKPAAPAADDPEGNHAARIGRPERPAPAGG